MRAQLASETLAQKRRRAAMARKTKSGGKGNRGGGRPRDPTVDRCPCGAQTLRRALARWPAQAGFCPECPSQ